MPPTNKTPASSRMATQVAFIYCTWFFSLVMSLIAHMLAFWIHYRRPVARQRTLYITISWMFLVAFDLVGRLLFKSMLHNTTTSRSATSPQQTALSCGKCDYIGLASLTVVKMLMIVEFLRHLTPQPGRTILRYCNNMGIIASYILILNGILTIVF